MSSDGNDAIFKLRVGMFDNESVFVLFWAAFILPMPKKRSYPVYFGSVYDHAF